MPPVLFVSHGAPTFALDPGIAGERLSALGRQLPRPEAVLIVSPHWMTRGSIGVTSSPRPETIHDFGGFPPPLYQLRYPAPGHPELALQTVDALRAAGFDSHADADRGLDHGAWVPLLHLFPNADIPVFQVSLPYPCDARTAWQLGQALKPLREQGVLVIGSGSLTHNLQEFRTRHGADAEYVHQFTGWVREALRENRLEDLIDYRRQAPDALRAHPTEEHFVPLLVALGAREAEDDALTMVDGGITHGVLAMDAYLFGAEAV